MPQLCVPADDEDSENEAEKTADEVRDEEDLATIGSVSDGAAKDREKQRRTELQRSDETERRRRRMGEIENQPILSNPLNPSSDVRQQ